MAGERIVYCSSCGAELTESARFCRFCGATQELAPPPPTPLPAAAPAFAPGPPRPMTAPFASTAPTPARTIGAFLAIAGGIGACSLVLWAVVYEPLHYHLSVLFGVGIQFGDALAFVAGAMAIALGAATLLRPAASPHRTMAALVAAAGLLVLILVLVWAFAETLGIDDGFSRPFYFGWVYFCQLGQAHIGGSYDNGYVQVPVLAASLGILLGGVLIAAAHDGRPGVPDRR